MNNYTTPSQVGMNLAAVQFTHHFLTQATTKGFTAEQIHAAIETPELVTAVTAHPGQLRYCGAGVAVVMDGTAAITIYADRIVTPLRDDQQADPNALNSRRLRKAR